MQHLWKSHFFNFLNLFFKKNPTTLIKYLDANVNFHNSNLYSRTISDWHALKPSGQVSQNITKEKET
jgi:hypothetical protein